MSFIKSWYNSMWRETFVKHYNTERKPLKTFQGQNITLSRGGFNVSGLRVIKDGSSHNMTCTGKMKEMSSKLKAKKTFRWHQQQVQMSVSEWHGATKVIYTTVMQRILMRLSWLQESSARDSISSKSQRKTQLCMLRKQSSQTGLFADLTCTWKQWWPHCCSP